MPRITAEAATKEFLSQPPANKLDGLMQNALKLFLAPGKRREGIILGTRMRRKLLLHEASKLAVIQSPLSPEELYADVVRSTSFRPNDIIDSFEVGDPLQDSDPSWEEHTAQIITTIAEFEISKKFPIIERLNEARWPIYDPGLRHPK